MTQSRANSWRDNSEMESLCTLGTGEIYVPIDWKNLFRFLSPISRVASASQIETMNQGLPVRAVNRSTGEPPEGSVIFLQK